MKQVLIYTDGSCHTQMKIGAWAAIIFCNEEMKIVKGVVEKTTHNAMELRAVIEAINFCKANFQKELKFKVFSDSQLVEKLPIRKEKLIKNNFLTKKGLPVQNVDLIKKMIHFLEALNIEIVKVKAHQKKTESENYNREVDKIVRKLLRNKVSSY